MNIVSFWIDLCFLNHVMCSPNHLMPCTCTGEPSLLVRQGYLLGTYQNLQLRLLPGGHSVARTTKDATRRPQHRQTYSEASKPWLVGMPSHKSNLRLLHVSIHNGRWHEWRNGTYRRIHIFRSNFSEVLPSQLVLRRVHETLWQDERNGES